MQFEILVLILSALLLSCKSPVDQFVNTMDKEETASGFDIDEKTSLFDFVKLRPEFGYRFEVFGDFDGDGTQENLREFYVSGINYKETNKYYRGYLDYVMLVELILLKEPIVYLKSNNQKLDSVILSKHPQHFGLSFLKNEGDLNGDGSDEVSFVISEAGWSSLNSWHIISLQKGVWKTLYSFNIWSWQLPQTPGTLNNYGMFGIQDKLVLSEADSINIILEKALKDFPGMVKKIKTNHIQVIYRTDEADLDTMIVDLRRVKNSTGFLNQ